jgi:large conductance mechanosensitive channel
VLKSEVNEVVDPSGKVVIPHGAEVAIEWGAFVTVVIDFFIVAFAMFLIIKGINTLKKKEAQSDADISSTDKLLTEIRDLLKK